MYYDQKIIYCRMYDYGNLHDGSATGAFYKGGRKP
jgi:hypothetical protein